AFDVHDLRDGVLRLVAKRVDDDAAAHRAVRARAARFARVRDLQRLCLRLQRSDVEAERRDRRAADERRLQEGPPGYRHRHLQTERTTCLTPANLAPQVKNATAVERAAKRSRNEGSLSERSEGTAAQAQPRPRAPIPERVAG